jgi:hypothetical protein
VEHLHRAGRSLPLICLVHGPVRWSIQAKKRNYFQEISEHGIFNGINLTENYNNMKINIKNSPFTIEWE